MFSSAEVPQQKKVSHSFCLKRGKSKKPSLKIFQRRLFAMIRFALQKPICLGLKRLGRRIFGLGDFFHHDSFSGGGSFHPCTSVISVLFSV